MTGFNPTLSLSEKVNDLHGGGNPPGTYHGQTTANVLRDVLQFAQVACVCMCVCKLHVCLTCDGGCTHKQADEQSAVGANEKAHAIM